MSTFRLLARLIVLASLAVSTPAAAKDFFGLLPGRERAPAPEPPASGSIPAPEVARRAEDASKLLRELDALLVPGPGVVAIERRLDAIGARLDTQTAETQRTLQESPASAALDGLTSQWETVRAELATYVNVLAERATALEQGLEHLTGLRETWTKARTDARASRAPAPVLGRIDGILTAAEQTRTRLQQERAATLVLQDRIAQLVTRCDDELARLAAARTSAGARLLARDGVALWSAERLAEAVGQLPAFIRQAVTTDLADLRRFAHDQRALVYAVPVVFAALALLIHAARKVASRTIVDSTAVTVLGRPFSSAMLLMFLAAAFTAPRSQVVRALGEMFALPPALRIVRLDLDPWVVPARYGLGVLLFVDLGRQLTSAVPLLEQQVFLVEVLAVIVMLGWKTRLPWRRSAPASDRGDAVEIVRGAILLAFVTAGVAAVAGYVRLALFIGAGILGNVYLALVLYAGVRVAGALLVVGLRSRPLRDLRMVQRHRPLLERQARLLLRWLAIGAWVVFALRHFGLWHSAVAVAGTALAAQVERGALSISVGTVLLFVAIVAATFGFSAIVRFVLEEELYPRLARERALPYALSSLVHYSLVLTGLLLGLAVLGLDLTKITILAGALGVGIGFGLQNLVRDFVSGLILLYERRINVGDAVQIADVGGRVQQLGIRACTVRTWEGAEVIVPNATLISEKVANWTLSDRFRRIDFPVSVAYGTSPEKVMEVLLGVARKHSDVLAEPPPTVLFVGFGEHGALRFELQAWTARFERWLLTRTELAVAGYAALREAGIDIPLPQVDVRLHQK